MGTVFMVWEGTLEKSYPVCFLPPGASPFSCHLIPIWHLKGGRPLDGWNLSKRNPFILFQGFYLKKKHVVFFCLRNRSGSGVYCLYLELRGSHILSTAKAQSGALSPLPTPWR